MKLRFLAGLTLLTTLAGTVSAFDFVDRRYLSIVGSSTVYPILGSVVEHVYRGPDEPSPVVEATGTGGGFKLFCAGLGLNTPDAVMASRRIKASERQLCEANEVAEIVEIQIGYDGIALVNSTEGAVFRLTREQLYRAMARYVPMQGKGTVFVRNPYRKWSQIDSALPDAEIRIYGPPPTSGTRDVLVEEVLDPICMTARRNKLPADDTRESAPVEELSEFRRQSLCQTLREDGVYINAGENDARLVRHLARDPTALGILGFNYLDQNPDLIQPALIEGVAPDFEEIESGNYPISRPLFLYVKRVHLRLVPRLQGFLDELTSDRAWGEDGYLSDRGLIPMPESERKRWKFNADLSGEACNLPQLPELRDGVAACANPGTS